MSEPQPSFLQNPSKPGLKLPPGACDVHFHVFGPHARFPFAAGRSYTPADAPKEKLFALHKHLGIGRGVVVQSAAHGFDNAASADLIAARRNDYVGVALLPVDVSPSEIKRLDEQGFRGVRFNYMKHLGEGTPIDQVISFSKKLADLGWHLQIHMDSSLIAQMAPALKRSAVPIVIDHMGRVDASLGLGQPPFRELTRLLNDKNIWVKVSGCERASRQASPWKDALPFARKLVAEFPERTLWGTDWPHPNLKDHMPDDGLLVDFIPHIAVTPDLQRKLLVDNPMRLYWPEQ
jgi:2-pyrone-4,6-dicarboxylate lactonase